MASTESPWRLYIHDKIDFNSSATVCRQYALTRDFLDLANEGLREEAALATMTDVAVRSFPTNITADCPVRP